MRRLTNEHRKHSRSYLVSDKMERRERCRAEQQTRKDILAPARRQEGKPGGIKNADALRPF